MIIFRIQFCGVFLKITAYPLLRTVQTIFVKSKHIQKEMSVLLQKFVTGYSM